MCEDLIESNWLKGRMLLLIASLLFLLPSLGFSVIEMPSKIINHVEDASEALGIDAEKELESRLSKYQNESGHVVLIRIMNHDVNKNEAAAKGQDLFNSLEESVGSAKSLTLIYLNVFKYSEGMNFSTIENVYINWDELAASAVDADDDVLSKGYSGSGLITHRLESKVLRRFFLDEDFNTGFTQCIDLIEQLHQGEIVSTDLEATIPSTIIGIIFKCFLVLVGFFVVMLVLAKLKGWQWAGVGQIWQRNPHNFDQHHSSAHGSNVSHFDGGGIDSGLGGGIDGDGSGGGDF